MEKINYLNNNSYITSDPNIESEDTIIIFPENDIEETYQEEDIEEMAEILEIDLKQNPEYKKFVYEALYAKLPENWRLYKNRKGEIFYIDILSDEKKDENPVFGKIREKIRKINLGLDLESQISGFDQNKFKLKKKNDNDFFLENNVSLQSLEKNFSVHRNEKKNFTFNKLNNDVVIIKKETFSDFNNQLNLLKNKIEKLEKTIENNPNLKTDRFKKNSVNENSEEKISKNFIKKKNSYSQFNNRGLKKSNFDIKNLDSLKKDNNIQSDYYYKKEKEENYQNSKNLSFVKNEKKENSFNNEERYKKNESLLKNLKNNEYLKNSKNDDYYLKSKRESFSKYSDPTFKSMNSQNLKNSEFKNLRNEVTNLKSIIDKYIDKEKPQNQIVYYNSVQKDNEIKTIYSPQKNLKRKIEHPNLTPFIQKSKESIIEKLDSFQKESEKKILKLDYCNKRMNILFDEKKKMEENIFKFSKLKNTFKKKKKYLKSLKKKIIKYNNDNKKSSKLFNDLKDTYKNLKGEYKEIEKEYFKEKTIVNLKKKLLEKFEVSLNMKNNTFDFYDKKIKEYFEELSNIKNLEQIEKNDSLIILEKDENEEKMNSSSVSIKSYKSLKKSFSINSLGKNMIKSTQKIRNIKKKKIEIKKKDTDSYHEYGSVKNLITNMQKKYNFPKRSEYYLRSENEKPKYINRSEHKFDNSFISKKSNKTFLAPINNMKKKSYSRESAIRKKRNFSNSICSRQTTYFKELRNEVDGILKSFNVSNMNKLS